MGVILIAFERESEQSALDELLSSHGHRVVRSGNGLVAWDSARREPPDAIISDIVLPRMDGFALCRKWKQDERLQFVPFLFYTRRYDDPKYERFALELGAERFLARSAPPESLLAALAEVLGPAAVAATRGTSGNGAATHGPALDPTLGAAQASSGPGPQGSASSAAARRVASLEAALDQAQRTHADALERAQQTHASLRSEITRLEASNRRLTAGEASFRRVFEANPMPMWIADRTVDGLIAVNDAALTLYGYDRTEFLALAATALEPSAAESPIASAYTQRRKDGRAIVVAIARHDIEFDARSAELVCVYDLSERLDIERQSRQQADAGRAAQEFLVDLFKQSASLDETAILHRALEQAAASTRSRLAWLYRVDPANKSMALAGWRDLGEPQATILEASPRPLAQAGLLADCVRGRQAATRSDPDPTLQQDGLPDLGGQLAVPALVDGEVVAVLGVANIDAGYGEEEQKTLIALADAVMCAMQAKRTQARTLRSLQRTDVALQGLIDSLVRISERHDPYTAGSSRRLATLAVMLGREAGLDGERQHALRVAALLHDVGNIAVPASILSKPAPLTETELALMRTHVDEGCQLLAEIDFGAPIADIIYQSHERYDGSGYPCGLKGEEILPEARILAIADTLEAMCSPRPYRPAVGIEAAIDEIDRAAGRLYDPDLVAACIRLVRQSGFSMPD